MQGVKLGYTILIEGRAKQLFPDPRGWKRKYSFGVVDQATGGTCSPVVLRKSENKPHFRVLKLAFAADNSTSSLATISASLMAKEKGKKLGKKGRNMNQPNGKIKKKNKVLKVEPKNAVVPAPLIDPAQASTSALPSEENRAASQNRDPDKETKNHLSGFIFMCNQSTKSECYQYRVFGLPAGKKEVVESITPGTKLFLFDFVLKRLYGVYEATSAGTMNLEPDAFRGKFPAQVKFKIFKECLPLHESSFRRVLKENYEGQKFKQELSGKQVRNLLSSFRPLGTSSQRLPRTLPNVSLSRARPPSTMEERQLDGVQHYNGPSVMEHQPVQLVHIPQHGYHGIPAYMGHAHPATEHRRMPINNLYYVAESRQPHFSEGHAYAVQEPHSRYGTVQERGVHDQLPGLRSEYRRLPVQREVLPQDEAVAYGSFSSYASSAVQPQSNAAGYSSYPAPIVPYAASAVQPQAPESVRLPVQREVLHQAEVVAYGSYGSYASSAVQPQPYAAGYSSYPAPTVPYAASVVQLQAPESLTALRSVQTRELFWLALGVRSSWCQRATLLEMIWENSIPVQAYESIFPSNQRLHMLRQKAALVVQI
ncbi:unnamed protein product [Fraxinus pennsylvanica]|uniref:DCD domain-containing protein n=1 Tax=Fraxinus pennsylvanica TaxID=56036 RepID=A0AAD2AF40_9LAMI|nr:unnamed protein product [Fraxinus pennsylvanica]